MSQATSNSFSSAELSIIAYVGSNIAKTPKNYKNIIQENFQNPIGSRRNDVVEVEKIFDNTLGKTGKLLDAVNQLEVATNHFCRLLGENIRLCQARQHVK